MFELDEGIKQTTGSGWKIILQASNKHHLVKLAVCHRKYNLKIIAKVENIKANPLAPQWTAGKKLKDIVYLK